jgi:hypothetical protein
VFRCLAFLVYKIIFLRHVHEKLLSLALSLSPSEYVRALLFTALTKELEDSNRSRICWICRHGSRRSFRARKARRYTSPPWCSSAHPRGLRYSGQVKFSVWFLGNCKEHKKKKKKNEVENLEVWIAAFTYFIVLWSSTWEMKRE